MNIYMQAEMGTCGIYLKKGDTDFREVSVVIAPTKLISQPGGQAVGEDGQPDPGDDPEADANMNLKLVSGCNLWRACVNADCWYSLAARQHKTNK